MTHLLCQFLVRNQCTIDIHLVNLDLLKDSRDQTVKDCLHLCDVLLQVVQVQTHCRELSVRLVTQQYLRGGLG